ncbi:DUF896 domain-containing protein [Alicyclobacillus dauci]|uniref:UPF0291 protein NZD86_05360 n=1 Tax=Alicyclobacillus dauci TaxID=1475485 RepID=A0ABY6Z4Z1_9BACL|nr:DUF896 domain-containing protein [Alicyclobacillus dauci]WAH37920.1 DUF896 domain-containing protein [Alicyclobacillus dauci]
MLHPEKIERLNHLARKSKRETLSDEEREEQRKLREEYLTNFRKEFRNHLDHIHVVDKDDIPPTTKH